MGSVNVKDSLGLQARTDEIAALATTLNGELKTLGLPEPTFDQGLPPQLAGDAPVSKASQTRLELMQKLDEFRALLTEPSAILAELRNPLIPLHLVIRLGIAEHFPAEGTTVQALAARLKLDESLVRRLLAHCACNHIYYRDAPDHFVHTAASRLLAENEGMRLWMRLGAEEIVPACLRTADALTKWPNSEEPEQSGWSTQNGTALPVFKELATQPERAMRFAGAMRWHAMLPGFSPQYLAEAFPNADQALTVVDVGGSLGHVSQVLVATHPKLKCIVEDFHDVVAQGERELPTRYAERVSFQAHDFFQPQPVKGADVYLVRMCLHDWSDKYARQVVEALVPALKKGSKVLVNERVVPGHGDAHYLVEREARDLDSFMMGFQNAKERTVDDWTTLFHSVSPHFRLVSVQRPHGSILSVLDFTWEG